MAITRLYTYSSEVDTTPNVLLHQGETIVGPLLTEELFTFSTMHFHEIKQIDPMNINIVFSAFENGQIVEYDTNIWFFIDENTTERNISVKTSDGFSRTVYNDKRDVLFPYILILECLAEGLMTY